MPYDTVGKRDIPRKGRYGLATSQIGLYLGYNRCVECRKVRVKRGALQCSKCKPRKPSPRKQTVKSLQDDSTKVPFIPEKEGGVGKAEIHSHRHTRYASSNAGALWDDGE